jgi:vitamin-K-epoxide reductase (warfarin-sensitive)
MRLLRILIVLLALGGVVDSTLALRIHNQPLGSAPPCAVTERWDCGAVNHSRFAVFPPTSFDEDPAAHHTHVPVAIFGILGYALIAALALANKPILTLQAAEIGFAFAAMLTYMEAYVLQKWCIYCVWSQALIACILACAACWLWLFLSRRVRNTA